MPLAIAILEDNLDRRKEMSACLHDRFPQFRIAYFAVAAEMARFLDSELDNTIAICLDHDLDLLELPDGVCRDPGTGRDIADYLASKPPQCPVIVHSTNSPAAMGMVAVLEEAGWTTRRVVPYGDLEWIPEAWRPVVRDAIVGTAAPFRPLQRSPAF